MAHSLATAWVRRGVSPPAQRVSRSPLLPQEVVPLYVETNGGSASAVVPLQSGAKLGEKTHRGSPDGSSTDPLRRLEGFLKL